MLFLLIALFCQADPLPTLNRPLQIIQDTWIRVKLPNGETDLTYPSFKRPEPNQVQKWTPEEILQYSVILYSKNTNGIQMIKFLTDDHLLPFILSHLKDNKWTIVELPLKLQERDLWYEKHSLVMSVMLNGWTYAPKGVKSWCPDSQNKDQWIAWTDWVKKRAEDKTVVRSVLPPIYAWENSSLSARIEEDYKNLVRQELQWTLKKLQIKKTQLQNHTSDIMDMQGAAQSGYVKDSSFGWACQEADRRSALADKSAKGAYNKVIQGFTKTKGDQGLNDSDLDQANQAGDLAYNKQLRAYPLWTSDEHYKYCKALFSDVINFERQRRELEVLLLDLNKDIQTYSDRLVWIEGVIKKEKKTHTKRVELK